MRICGWVAGLAGAMLLLTGCGGGGSSSSGAGTPPTTEKVPLGTARVRVDLKTNQVTITSLDGTAGGASSNAIYTGSAIKLAGVTVSSEGSPERRTLSVQATNNTADLIDSDSLGMKVIFSNFRNINSLPIDNRGDVTVRTYAGNGSTGTATGPVGSTNFNNPSCVWRYTDGTILVSDTQNNRIVGIRDGSSNTIAVGEAPIGMAGYVTPPAESGNWVLMCCSSSHLIKAFRISDGSVRNIAGSGANTSNDGTLASCTIASPSWISADPNVPGRFYFIDQGNSSLRQLDIGLNSVTTIKVFAAQPFACCVLSSGAVVVSLPSISQMQVINPLNPGTQVIVLGSVPGYAEGVGSGLLFGQPGGMVASGNTIYYCDSSNNRLRQIALAEHHLPYDASGWWGSTLAGNGTASDIDGTSNTVTFNQPIGVGLGQDNQLYVTEYGGDRVRQATARQRFPVGISTGTPSPLDTTVLADADGYIPAANGKLPYYAQAGPLAPAATMSLKDWHFILPEGLTAFDFVVTIEADSPTLAALASVSNPGPALAPGSPSVNVRTFAGTVSGGTVDGPPSVASLGVSQGLAVLPSGYLVFSDASSHIIRRYNHGTGQILTIAGRAGTTGSADSNGRDARFNAPSGIASSSDGREILVCDSSNHTIRRLQNLDGLDDPLNWTVQTIAGLAGTAGSADGTTGVDARLNQPFGIVQISPNVYAFTERAGNRVRTLTFLGGDRSLAANWRVGILAGDNAATIGAPGLVNTRGTAARFRNPMGITLSPQGDLYVADTGNHVVRKLTTGGDATTLAGSASGYADGSDVSAKFVSPTFLAADSSGYLFVCDEGNAAIRRISPSGTVRTVACGGAAGFDDGTGATATFSATLRAVAIDARGNLFVSDGRRLRLLERIISTGVGN